MGSWSGGVITVRQILGARIRNPTDVGERKTKTIIIVEGCRKSGKTDLALKLRESLPGWSYRSGREGKQIGAGPNHLLSLVADCQSKVIFDEFHCTARLARTLRVNYPPISPQQWKVLELALLSRGALVAWCPLCKNPDREPQLPLGEQMAATDGILTGSLPCHLPRYHFNGSEKDAEVFQSLLEAAKWQAGCVSALPPPSQGIGSREAKFLVLGEAPFPRPDFQEPDLPFSRGPSAKWLWKAFDVVGLQWQKGYYTLATSFRSIASFTDLVSQQLTEVETIFCVGKRAEGLARLAMQRSGRPRDVQVLRPYSPHREFDTWCGEVGEALKEWCDGVAAMKAVSMFECGRY